MVNSTILVVALVIGIIGSGLGSYYVTSAPLNAQISSDQTTISAIQSEISNQQSVISSMSAHPSTTTVYSTLTTTSVSVTTSTSTSTIYPSPNNVTIEFTGGANGVTYNIQSPTFNSNGALSSSLTFTKISSYAGETFTVSASPNGLETPSGALFYGYLFINGTLVDQGSGTGYGGFTFSVTV